MPAPAKAGASPSPRLSNCIDLSQSPLKGLSQLLVVPGAEWRVWSCGGREADITGRHSFAVPDEIKPSAPALDQLGSGYEAARIGRNGRSAVTDHDSEKPPTHCMGRISDAPCAIPRRPSHEQDRREVVQRAGGGAPRSPYAPRSLILQPPPGSARLHRNPFDFNPLPLTAARVSVAIGTTKKATSCYLDLIAGGRLPTFKPAT